MSVTYKAYSSFYPDIETIKVSTTDTTLTNTANAAITNGGTPGIVDALASLISATTEPFIAGAPYVTSTGSAILFVVRADAFTQSTLQTAVQAITGLSGATVAISTTLVG